MFAQSWQSAAVAIKFQNEQGLTKIPNQTIWAIAKDPTGFMWFGNDTGLFRYDGFQIKTINSLIPNANIRAVRSIHFDDHGIMWVGSKGQGLFQVINNHIVRFNAEPTAENQDTNFITAMVSDVNGLWFTSYNYLNFIDSNNQITRYDLPGSSKKTVVSNGLIKTSNQQLLLTTVDAVYSFDLPSKQFIRQTVKGMDGREIISIYQDNNNIWLATNQGVLLKPKNGSEYSPYLSESIHAPVNTILFDDDDIWLGTTLQGLLKISKTDQSISQYMQDNNNSDSIPGNSVMRLFSDDAGLIFISNFHKGVSYFDASALKFGMKDHQANAIDCAKSSIFYGVDVDENNVIWLSTQSGLVEYSINNNVCTQHALNLDNKPAYNNHNPKYSFKDSNNTRWITTTNGLNKLDIKTGLIDTFTNNNLDEFINFMIEIDPAQYLIGSNNGLYSYNLKSFSKIKLNNKQSDRLKVFAVSKPTSQGYFLATNQGLAIFNKSGEFNLSDKHHSQLPGRAIGALLVNDKQQLWIAVNQLGLFQFDNEGNLVRSFSSHPNFGNIYFKSIIQQQENLWISSDSGLIQFNTASEAIHFFHENDGLQDAVFFTNAAAKGADGKLYFAGRKGLNAFYSKDIKINSQQPEIALTQFTRFGKPVQANAPNNDFILTAPINDMNLLTLTHKDYVIGFEFAVLDYADPPANQYAYKMEGLDPDWNYVNAENRRVSYTNLNAGDYIFKVKGANKDGVWNESGKQLKIEVYPVPWLSWWAYTLYILTFFILLFAYLYHKNKANQKITLRLRAEVDRQTKELQEQKQTVETLLDKKNELFANVSHEFRTPLTLILGPINKLLKTQLAREDLNTLQIVNRNANRLLTMIEQILQLAKLTDEENITRVPQQVHTQVEIIVESFQILAETKGITLTLKDNDVSAINATQDSIEIILGNLLSNAIKYTPVGGSVNVYLQVNNNAVTLSVTDTGCGLDEQQQIDIFNRFERLEAHHDIAGVGIGLSLVAEMVKVNMGHIVVTSQPGEGSKFAVIFEGIELQQVESRNSNKQLIDQLIKDSVLDEQYNNEALEFIGNKNNPNLLIIDDNQDMREHIADSLKNHYYCMLAPRGKAGIALAIKHIPEIIICDVMMPEMDGFQVSRILRSDSRTSHIPLILLTALNDKKSRIKGWRENIDVYLTKPFDAQELLLQIENIRVIRNILKKQANAAIHSGKVSMNSGLAKLDQKFLDKFIGIIEEMYNNPHFLRPQMAKMMAVSERQLQRKIKGLIDRNPLDLLREYRLKKAGEILKDGYQVSVTADKCGFNSVTYFSKCFKQQYGITPKEYQSTCQTQPKE